MDLKQIKSIRGEGRERHFACDNGETLARLKKKKKWANFNGAQSHYFFPLNIFCVRASLLNTAIQNKNLAHKNLGAGGNHVPRLLEVFVLLPLLGGSQC